MKLRDYLGLGRESETPRYGILSSRAEWHAFLVGITVGIIVAIVGGKDAAWLFIILTSIAIGGREVNVGHLRHVKNEPVYALVGAVSSFLVGTLYVVPQLSHGVI
jgi:hypothetical protein